MGSIAKHDLPIRTPAGRRCTLVVGPGALRRLGAQWRDEWTEAAIVGDAQVLGLYGDAVRAQLEPVTRQIIALDFEPGEAQKSRSEKARLEDELLAAGFGRRGCIVALGGGISLDLAGFVAATYLRGVPVLNVPTSLLAMVDAALGGKTAVNVPAGKNLIGAFHQPSAILVDPELLATLPPAEWLPGLAELVKHAAVADGALFEWIEDHASALGEPGPLDPQPLLRSLQIKAAIVAADERETGSRAVLNFGHTLAHAIEKASEHRVGHGLAVAMGMGIEAAVAVERCGLAVESWRRLIDLWPRLGLRTWPEVALDDLWPFLRTDKKRRDETMHLALPTEIGQMAVEQGRHTVAVSAAELGRGWERWRRGPR